MNKWTSFKQKVSDHSEEIVGGTIIVGTVALYAVFCGLVYKAAKDEQNVKKAQFQLLNNAIELQRRELNAS